METNDIINYFNKTTPTSSKLEQQLVTIISGLLFYYFDRVPDAKQIFKIMIERGDTIQNDHIAFRTIDVRSLLTLFLFYGFSVQFDDKTRTPFNFTQKKITAVWLKHPNPAIPRLFISEFRLDETPTIKQYIAPYLDQINDTIDSVDLNDTTAVIDYLHTSIWPTPTYEHFDYVRNQSEYLSWVMYNQYYLNHFTLTVNSLQSFGYQQNLDAHFEQYFDNPDILKIKLREEYRTIMSNFNQFLQQEGFQLNSPKGSTLQISNDGLLLQSSTQSGIISANFPDGTYDISGSYVEFAYRGILETSLNKLSSAQQSKSLPLRDGFEVGNADKIFESTYTNQPSDYNDKGTELSCFDHSKQKINTFLDSYQIKNPHSIPFNVN